MKPIQKPIRGITIEQLYAAFCHEPYFVFFDSADTASQHAQYSLMMWAPFQILTVRKNTLELQTQTEKKTHPFSFDQLYTYLTPYIEGMESDLPFCGGVVSLLGYEAARYLSDFRHTRSSEMLPEMIYLFYDHAVLYHHKTQELSWVTAPFKNITPTPEPNFQVRTEMSFSEINLESPQSLWTQAAYLNAFKQVKRYIEQGDVYQVNLSHRFSVPFKQEQSASLYWQLRQVSPAPYGVFMNTPTFSVFSASPELFVSIDHQTIQTHPIKGTRPRGQNPEEDQALKTELLQAEKDAAELTMIVDLERNDLNKICKQGTVKVRALKVLETYAQVHHLVSPIEGELDQCRHPEAIFALFPGGSITGAPKIRATEIIQELEPCPRELYTGVIGYHSANQKSQFNIAIRSMYSYNETLYFHSGGGIVADSRGGAEWQETQTKIKGLVLSMTRKT